MNMEKNEINENFWFDSNCKSDISQLKTSLSLFIQNFDKASTLKEYPLFLDTNVLLLFYKVSNKVKNNFLNFLKDNIDNIYITEHVKNEFLKSRLKVINEDYLKVVSDVPKELKKQSNKITNFININKSILEDYDEIYLDLKEIESELTRTHDKLNVEINKNLEKNKNIKYNDILLEEYSRIQIVNNITENELTFIKEKYNYLKEKASIVFPGMMDGKQKNENDDGDFIIFHEMMKYMKEYNTSVVFLTNDKKKDWFEIDGNNKRHPQINYIESTYNNTQQFNYILEADRTLSSLLNIHIESNTFMKNIEKENEILKKQNFYLDWSNDEFLRILNKSYLEKFSHPVSEIKLEFDTLISNIDFHQLLDENSTTGDFHGEGVAIHRNTDTDGNEIMLKTPFYFLGSCNIDNINKAIDINNLDIEEHDIEIG